MNEQEQKYRQLLASHDWYYDYSDDYSMWSRGKSQRDTLRNMREKIDPDYKIWNEIAPADFKARIQN